MTEGWIQLHRSLREWEWFTDVNASHLFIYCLLRANHKDVKWRGIAIGRGQFVTSLDTISKETGLSVMQVRTAIKKLVLTNELTNQSTNINRLITVTNYNKYQSDNKPDNKPLTKQQQTSNKAVTTDNNKNNNNNENNNNKDIGDSIESTHPQQMIDIWNNKVQTVLTGGKILNTKARVAKLKLRLKEYCNNNLDDWSAYCEQIASTPFLMGDNNRQWKISIDWALEPKNITKIIENNYERANTKPAESSNPHSNFTKGLQLFLSQTDEQPRY